MRAALRPLEGIRSVLFDIYGTLLVSLQGESPGGSGRLERDSMVAALLGSGLMPPDQEHANSIGEVAVRWLHESVAAVHEAQVAAGIGTPEVEIRLLWSGVVERLFSEGMIRRHTVSDVELAGLAVRYEALINPCWPMPGVREVLARLHASGILLGIISNSQFYTRDLLTVLLGDSLDDLGFHPDLEHYSFEYGEAKPGRRMFAAARQMLLVHGISADQVLYVGNDMLNDVLPANGEGFRTALFAGDARSLRLRTDDPRTSGLSPDLIITCLSDLERCLCNG
jgi:putative hydrolase of the HAD superfamily